MSYIKHDDADEKTVEDSMTPTIRSVFLHPAHELFAQIAPFLLQPSVHRQPVVRYEQLLSPPISSIVLIFPGS